MAARAYGTFIFGIPETLPALPEGWAHVTSEKDWLKATAEDGKTYLLTKDQAFPMLRNSQRSINVDMENPVPLPTSSLTPAS